MTFVSKNKDKQQPVGPETKVREACNRARMKVVRALGAIIDSHIEAAKDGSYQHAKFLFEWAALTPQAAPEVGEENGAESLARYLLDGLGQPPTACECATMLQNNVL